MLSLDSSHFFIQSPAMTSHDTEGKIHILYHGLQGPMWNGPCLPLWFHSFTFSLLIDSRALSTLAPVVNVLPPPPPPHTWLCTGCPLCLWLSSLTLAGALPSVPAHRHLPWPPSQRKASLALWSPLLCFLFYSSRHSLPSPKVFYVPLFHVASLSRE